MNKAKKSISAVKSAFHALLSLLLLYGTVLVYLEIHVGMSYRGLYTSEMRVLSEGRALFWRASLVMLMIFLIVLFVISVTRAWRMVVEKRKGNQNLRGSEE